MAELGIDGHKSNRSLGPLWRVNRRLRNVKGTDMKIFQTPSYDRFCLFEMERKSKDFRGMDDNVAYKISR